MKYDLFSEGFFANPDPTLQRMRVEDPVYWEPALQAWVLTRYRDVRWVLRDAAFCSERATRTLEANSPHVKEKLAACQRFLSKFLIFSDAPLHTRLRSVIGKVFTHGAVTELEPFMRAELDELLGPALEAGRLDVIADLAFPLASAASARLIGLPLDFVPRMARWSAQIFPLFGSGIVSEEVVDTAYQCIVECHESLARVVTSSDPEASRGLMGRLMEAAREGLIHEEEVIASCAMLVIGGHESAAHTIGNGLLALLRNPAALEKVRRHPELLDKAVEELIRYEGSAVSLLRRARRRVDVSGTAIDAGHFVFPVIRAANRDPEIFPDPDRLNVEREPNPHLGLGYGAHFCVGAALARLQLKLTIGALVGHSLELELPDTELCWIPSLATRGLHSLPVRVGVGRAQASSIEGLSGKAPPSSSKTGAA